MAEKNHRDNHRSSAAPCIPWFEVSQANERASKREGVCEERAAQHRPVTMATSDEVLFSPRYPILLPAPQRAGQMCQDLPEEK